MMDHPTNCECVCHTVSDFTLSELTTKWTYHWNGCFLKWNQLEIIVCHPSRDITQSRISYDIHMSICSHQVEWCGSILRLKSDVTSTGHEETCDGLTSRLEGED